MNLINSGLINSGILETKDGRFYEARYGGVGWNYDVAAGEIISFWANRTLHKKLKERKIMVRLENDGPATVFMDGVLKNGYRFKVTKILKIQDWPIPDSCKTTEI